jgi:hypothetical protein
VHLGVGWSRTRIFFLFREIRNHDESNFNFAKFREISLYFLSRYFAKFHNISRYEISRNKKNISRNTK